MPWLKQTLRSSHAWACLALLVLLVGQGRELMALAGVNLANVHIAQTLRLPSNELEHPAQLELARQVAAWAIATAPDLKWAYLAAGRVDVLQGRPAKAVPALTIAADSMPVDEMSALFLGNVLDTTGDYSEAVRRWAQVSNITRRFLFDGDQRLKQGNLVGADAAYQRVVDIAHAQQNRDREAAGYRGLGNVARTRGQWNQAIAYCRLAVDLVPDDCAGVAALAHTLSMAGRNAEARVIAERSLAMQPNWLAYLVLGELSYKEGQLTRAAMLYAAAASLRPDDPWAWHWMGVISGKQGDKTAEAQYRARAAALDPSFATTPNAMVKP